MEVWEWISNFIPHYTRCVITYPCWDKSQSMLVKGSPGRVYGFQTVIIMYLIIPNYWLSIRILNKLQSSAIITRSNITWYCIHLCSDWSRKPIRIEIPKDTPYLALTGELWGVLCEDFRENFSRYNGSTLYINTAPADVRPSIFARTSVGKILWLQHIKNGFLSISSVKDSDDIFVQETCALC